MGSDAKAAEEAREYIRRRRKAEAAAVAYIMRLLAMFAAQASRDAAAARTRAARRRKRREAVADAVALVTARIVLAAAAGTPDSLQEAVTAHAARRLGGLTLRQRLTACLSMYYDGAAGGSAEAAQAAEAAGRKRNPGGGSSNGRTAARIGRIARYAVADAWMKSRDMQAEASGATGYYVMRGSGYPCHTCDAMTGYHPIADTGSLPPYHPNCCCYTVYEY